MSFFREFFVKLLKRVSVSIFAVPLILVFNLLFSLPLQSANENRFVVSLYTGIQNFVTLGENRNNLLKKKEGKFSEIEIPKSEEFKQSGISSGLNFSSLGVKIFFIQNDASLLIIENPFSGTIQGKDLNIFDVKKPSAEKWPEFVERRFGKPDLIRSSSSSLVGDVYFYSWGEVHLSNYGIRKIFIYRDSRVKRFRETSTLSPEVFSN